MTMTVPQTSVTTSQVVGMPGQLADLPSMADALVGTGINAEAATDFVFGTFVKRFITNDDDGCKVCTSQADILRGIVVHSHDFERLTELSATGVKPTSGFGVLERGRVFVLPGTDVTPLSEVHVQVVAEGGHPVGTIRGTASAAKTIDITALARWITSATVASGKVAILEIDMTNIGLAAVDS